MKSLSLRAYAKVNLSLNVTGKRQDGYHDIESVMQSIALYDSLTVEKVSLTSSDSRITISVDGDDTIPQNSDNLAYKAAEAALLLFETPKETGIHIALQKNIPAAAGLAGGSSDAAATILAVSLLLERKETLQVLCTLGQKLGADIPFCISANAHASASLGGRNWEEGSSTSLAEGIGDILTPLNAPGGAVILVKPPITVSTPTVYRQFDIGKHRGMVSDTTALRKALSQKGAPDTKLLLANMKNALQDPAISLHPKIQEILNIVQNTVTADHVQMSGSGPTIVAYYLAEHMHTLPDDVRLLKAILKDYGCLICFAPLLS